MKTDTLLVLLAVGALGFWAWKRGQRAMEEHEQDIEETAADAAEAVYLEYSPVGGSFEETSGAFRRLPGQLVL